MPRTHSGKSIKLIATIAQLSSMKTTHIVALAFVGAVLSGCAKLPQGVTPMMARAEYSAKEPIATSLFPSDQAVLGDESVARILSSKLELPAKAKLALMKFPESE